MTDDSRKTESSKQDLVSALTSQLPSQANQTAQQTRRVISTSLGVLRQQQAGRRRPLLVALAAAVVAILLLGPLVWTTVDNFFEEELSSGQIWQVSIVLIFLTAAVLASIVLAGWVRRKP